MYLNGIPHNIFFRIAVQAYLVFCIGEVVHRNLLAVYCFVLFFYKFIAAGRQLRFQFQVVFLICSGYYYVGLGIGHLRPGNGVGLAVGIGLVAGIYLGSGVSRVCPAANSLSSALRSQKSLRFLVQNFSSSAIGNTACANDDSGSRAKPASISVTRDLFIFSVFFVRLIYDLP